MVVFAELKLPWTDQPRRPGDRVEDGPRSGGKGRNHRVKEDPARKEHDPDEKEGQARPGQQHLGARFEGIS